MIISTKNRAADRVRGNHQDPAERQHQAAARPQLQAQAIRGRLRVAKPLEYLLIVSTIEPRKNHLTLLSAWERLRVERFPALKLARGRGDRMAP